MCSPVVQVDVGIVVRVGGGIEVPGPGREGDVSAVGADRGIEGVAVGRRTTGRPADQLGDAALGVADVDVLYAVVVIGRDAARARGESDEAAVAGDRPGPGERVVDAGAGQRARPAGTAREGRGAGVAPDAWAGRTRPAEATTTAMRRRPMTPRYGRIGPRAVSVRCQAG